MNFIGADIGGGVITRQQVVVGFSVRQAGGSDAAARGCQVFIVEIAPECGISRHDFPADDRTRFLGQGRALRGGERFRIAFERRIEAAFLRIGNDLCRDLRRHPGHNCLRRRPPAPHAFTHQCDVLLDQGRQCIQACQPVAVILFCGEGQQLSDAVGGLHPALVGHRHQVFAERLAFDVFLQQPFESVVMELVRCTQALALDGVQAVHGGAIGGLAVGNRLQAQIGPTVVEACVAIVGGVLRAFAHAALPLVGEQPVQCGVACIGMCCRYQGEEQEQKGRKSHQ